MKAKICIFVLILFGMTIPVFAQTPEELIAEGDQLLMEVQDLETANQILSKYQKALGLQENKYDSFWRIARIMYYIGSHTEKKKEKKKIFAQAVYHATKAVREEPEKPDGYYWLAVNNGKVGETRGILKSLSLVKPIKKALNKVIELDRSYEDGGADRVLGRVFFKVPGIAGGSKDKALEHLLKSKELGPDDVVTRLYLAEALLAKKEKEKARAELEYIINLEDDPRWINAVQEKKAEAKKLLKKKFK
ncbi:MAG: tetratricopeptide repeat protein [Candidatus Aminicenantes bacterium]|nr:tetratricopeptide repeat protein [Candidatus Aminicenantes bacterium]